MDTAQSLKKGHAGLSHPLFSNFCMLMPSKKTRNGRVRKKVPRVASVPKSDPQSKTTKDVAKKKKKKKGFSSVLHELGVDPRRRSTGHEPAEKKLFVKKKRRVRGGGERGPDDHEGDKGMPSRRSAATWAKRPHKNSGRALSVSSTCTPHRRATSKRRSAPARWPEGRAGAAHTPCHA